MPQQTLGELFTSVINKLPSTEDVEEKYEKPVSGIPAADIENDVLPKN